jgi:hypothetical protein
MRQCYELTIANIDLYEVMKRLVRIIFHLFRCLGHYISEDMFYIWLSTIVLSL